MRNFIIILFLLLFTVHPTGLIVGVGSDDSENRASASMPDFSVDRLFNGEFIQEFESYFNDNFSIRAPLISAKKWIDFHIFRTSPTNKVLIGKDGWLFYNYTILNYHTQSCERRARAVITTVKRLQMLERELERAGKMLVLTVAPNKATIYPEYFPKPLPLSRCGKSQYDLFLEALRYFPIKGFVRLDTLLLDAKSSGEPIYFKADTHWNIRGAELASKALLQRISPESWENFFRLEDDFPIRKRKGGLERMIGDLGLTSGINFRSKVIP